MTLSTLALINTYVVSQIPMLFELKPHDDCDSNKLTLNIWFKWATKETLLQGSIKLGHYSVAVKINKWMSERSQVETLCTPDKFCSVTSQKKNRDKYHDLFCHVNNINRKISKIRWSWHANDFKSI